MEKLRINGSYFYLKPLKPYNPSNTARVFKFMELVNSTSCIYNRDQKLVINAARRPILVEGEECICVLKNQEEVSLGIISKIVHITEYGYVVVFT